MQTSVEELKKAAYNTRAWKLLYILMDDVKTIMDNKYRENDGDIPEKDVKEMFDYVRRSLDQIETIVINDDIR